jgi:hypothetical protein
VSDYIVCTPLTRPASKKKISGKNTLAYFASDLSKKRHDVDAPGLDVRPHRQPRHLRQQGELRKTVAAVQHPGKEIFFNILCNLLQFLQFYNFLQFLQFFAFFTIFEM